MLDVFDEWKRSVGVSAAGGADSAGDESGADLSGRAIQPSCPPRARHRPPDHTARRQRSIPLDPVFDDAVRELDAARADTPSLRGDAREALIDRLRQLDASLIERTARRCDRSTLERLSAEADEELKSFRARMPAEAYLSNRIRRASIG